MSTSAQESLGTIDEFVQEVGATKTAAEAHTEAGGYEGATTHAVKDVDDKTEAASEGARSAENTEDVKDPDIGPGKPSVDATADATAKVGAAEGSAADDQMQIGANVQATGDDPSNETSGTKNTKDDDGYEAASAHPARTDNSEIDGHKYAQDLAAMPLEKLAEFVGDLGNQVCADLATEAGTAKQAMDEKCPSCKEAKNMCKCAAAPAAGGKVAADGDLTPEIAKQVGWEMAGLVTGNFDKTAADKLVKDTLKDVVKTASDDGDNVVSYLSNFYASKAQAEKEAAEKAAMGEDAAMAGMPGGAPGGPPPGADPMAAMGGGAPGAEDPMAAMGGAAPGAEDPAAAMAGGAEGGAPSPEQLEQVLEMLNIDPQELAMALEQQQGGELGGEDMGAMPPGLGGEEGMPAGAPGGAEMPPDAGAMEAQASAATLEEKKAALTNYVKEVVTRSRQKRAADLQKSAAALAAPTQTK